MKHASESIMQPSAAVPASGVRVWAGVDFWPALGVLVLGLTILYGVGFSNFQRAHNAAHDTRHASGFPCH